MFCVLTTTQDTIKSNKLIIVSEKDEKILMNTMLN